MCGVAEASLALTAISAVAGFIGASNAAKAQTAQNRRIDDAHYAGYKAQLGSIDRKQAQERRKIGAKQFEQTIEVKQTQGRTQSELDQMGYGNFALSGRSPDAIMHDIRCQRGVGQARLKQYETDMFAEMGANREMAYLNYRAQNAQLPLVDQPSIIDLGAGLGDAGIGYFNNPNRMKSGPFTGTGGYTASQYNAMSGSVGVPW